MDFELSIVAILNLLVAIVVVALLVRYVVLTKKIKKVEVEIKREEHCKEMAGIISDHVNEQMLRAVKDKMEKALKKESHINNFGDLIRPALDTIMAYTNEMANGTMTPEERQNNVANVSRLTKQLTLTVEKVLLQARIDSDNVIYDMKEWNVEDVFSEVYSEFEGENGSNYSITGSNRMVLRNINGRPGMSIMCDKNYLVAALKEIMENAFKFSIEGDIMMGWFYRLDSNEVEFFIEDNGMGIPQERQSSVFEVFNKVNRYTYGAGVGLSITDALVNAMGGRILLVSREHVGTRVSVLFPLCNFRSSESR